MAGPAPALRVATTADSQEVEALMQASARDIFPAYYDAEQTASALRFVARVDPTLLEDGTYYVLDAEGELVGCGGWSRRGRPYMGSAATDADERFLDPATEAVQSGRCSSARTGRAAAWAGGSSNSATLRRLATASDGSTSWRPSQGSRSTRRSGSQRRLPYSTSCSRTGFACHALR